MVGSLLYLSVCTRPDIAEAVGKLARYMAKPTAAHWGAAKGVLRYLAGTAEMGITFKGSEAPLVGYCDSDYAGDIDSRRSTTGYVFIVHGGAVSWNSKLQATVEYLLRKPVTDAAAVNRSLAPLKQPSRLFDLLNPAYLAAR